jgi:hypothetical protein
MLPFVKTMSQQSYLLKIKNASQIICVCRNNERFKIGKEQMNDVSNAIACEK